MTLNKIALAICCMLLAAACKEEPKTCQDFHEGNFEISKPEENYLVQIERVKNLQIETNENTGDITKAVVTWTNICNYELRYIESTSPNAVNLIGKVLQVRITGIQGDSYTYEAVLRGSQTITKGRITMID